METRQERKKALVDKVKVHVPSTGGYETDCFLVEGRPELQGVYFPSQPACQERIARVGGELRGGANSMTVLTLFGLVVNYSCTSESEGRSFILTPLLPLSPSPATQLTCQQRSSRRRPAANFSDAGDEETEGNLEGHDGEREITQVGEDACKSLSLLLTQPSLLIDLTSHHPPLRPIVGVSVAVEEATNHLRSKSFPPSLPPSPSRCLPFLNLLPPLTAILPSASSHTQIPPQTAEVTGYFNPQRSICIMTMGKDSRVFWLRDPSVTESQRNSSRGKGKERRGGGRSVRNFEQKLSGHVNHSNMDVKSR